MALVIDMCYQRVCQYAILDEKVAHILHYVLIKSTQSTSKSVSYGLKIPAKGGRHGKRHVWIFV